MKKSEFDAIEWPPFFIIEFSDGDVQHFDSSNGVTWDNGKNNDGSDENRASLTCRWKKKSPAQQSFKLIEFFADEINSVYSESGKKLWCKNV